MAVHYCIREAYLVAGHLGFGSLALLLRNCSQITNPLRLAADLIEHLT
jgi:hypothetical protein